MRSVLFAVSVLALTIGGGAAAEGEPLASTMKQRGYVSLPLTQGPNHRLQFKGVLHGSTLRFVIDLTNEESLFDLRALRKLDIEFEATEIRIPTPTKKIRIHTARIMGIEFASVSTGPLAIHAGDLDAYYRIRPGQKGPDAALGTKFLATYGGLIDIGQSVLYLKLP